MNEVEITEFFNDVIDRALGEKQEGGAVVSVYINRERHFAFVELRTIELTTACMNLDGISFRTQPLKVRRPNDYNPATVPKELGPIPQLNLAALGIVSTTVSDGPGKVFVGGLPYHLNEEQVKELLQAFGPLRSFHLVKELNSNLSKGYGFCEYMDLNVTDAACLGLNGMKLGDKTLTVRRAMSQENAKAVASAAGTVNSGLEMGLDPSQAAMQVMSMAGLGIPSTPLGPPSRVLVLLNMVTPEELEDEEEYADIVDDIKTECERFGSVNSILVPRARDGTPGAVGKVVHCSLHCHSRSELLTVFLFVCRCSLSSATCSPPKVPRTSCTAAASRIGPWWSSSWTRSSTVVASWLEMTKEKTIALLVRAGAYVYTQGTREFLRRPLLAALYCRRLPLLLQRQEGSWLMLGSPSGHLSGNVDSLQYTLFALGSRLPHLHDCRCDRYVCHARACNWVPHSFSGGPHEELLRQRVAKLNGLHGKRSVRLVVSVVSPA